ncbi:Hypothetical predicted protein [Mytilus galloprovincialis]|uniref:Uncharacterized protein n=1 Tax=Mytilus galloprovincialis TaxID=29158 RepID=A0A8B6FRX5_MYTGA|nr:Hypothetical predicted protein [Mytilus galloprovincialis]
MTKGELYLAPGESDGPVIGQEFSGLLFSNEHRFNGYSGYEIQKDSEKHSFSNPDDTNNNNIRDIKIDIAEYVKNLQDDRVRKKLVKALSTDEPDENLDIENMNHYLLVAKRSNLHNTLICCENKLISNLNTVNCNAYYNIAQEYELRNLQSEALAIIKRTGNPDECSNFKNQNNNFSIEGAEVSNNSSRGSLGNSRTKTFQDYYSLFTCGTCGSKRTITTIVYDSNMRNRCYRNIKKGKKISKQFQCCCIQGDENNPPIVYWSFGSSVYQYDPLRNKCKKRASLYCKRANFNMISHEDHCYVIGGVYKGRKVLEIEEYNMNSWKKVAYLPGDSLPINPSCVVFDGLIYIFSSILDIDNKIKPGVTAVYVFHPRTKAVKYAAEIPFSFKQTKTCVVDSFIYIASDKKHFIRFCPSDGSCISLHDQIQECKDFGMFTMDKSIVLAGGDCRGKEYKDINVYCTVSGHWETLSEQLPDDMAIYGACELKIPKSAGTIVPFYETNLFKKR